MLRLQVPDEYEIAVYGYTSDSRGKNLQAEWYAIKVSNQDPHPFSYLDLDYLSLIENIEINVSFSANENEKVKINPPSSVMENEKGAIKTEPLHPFSIVRMMYQSTQHAFLRLAPWYSAPVFSLFSLGGLVPVGSDSDGDGVWSLVLGEPDAGWKEVPRMNFPNRYNPQSVADCGNLYVLGGFSRSQFPAEAAAKGVGWMESYHPLSGWKPLPNPPSGFSFNDDPLIFTAFDIDGKILIAQYNHDDMNCDSATFYVYDVMKKDWTTLEPPVRKLFARYLDRTGRRSVAVYNTLY